MIRHNGFHEPERSDRGALSMIELPFLGAESHIKSDGLRSVRKITHPFVIAGRTDYFCFVIEGLRFPDLFGSVDSLDAESEQIRTTSPSEPIVPDVLATFDGSGTERACKSLSHNHFA